ncbi:MAG: hypothetical protein PHQ23_16920 [Candidatus Wallbacteria bacterium]|nr:hypothetical protein [Candidatus Wallbacteria bacterium]
MEREQFKIRLSAFFDANLKRKNFSFSGFEDLEACLMENAA